MGRKKLVGSPDAVLKSGADRAKADTPDGGAFAPVLTDLRQIIAAARERVATAVNAELTMLYWRLGKRLHLKVLREQRAEYGKQIVAALGAQLSNDFGRGFDRANLFRMLQFAEQFPEEPIVATLSRQLTGALECAHPPRQDQWHALRANCAVK